MTSTDDKVNLNAKDASGNPHIPADSHMALARKEKIESCEEAFLIRGD